MEERITHPVTRTILTERRSGGDRRNQRLGNLIWLLKTGQRRRMRRKSDLRRLRLLDYYSPRLFYSVTLVLLLSVADAWLTLWLIERGANEANPVMAYFLQFGPDIFLLAKYLLTSMAVVIVVLLHYSVIRFFKVPFQVLMQFFACCFGMVVAWELYLVARLML